MMTLSASLSRQTVILFLMWKPLLHARKHAYLQRYQTQYRICSLLSDEHTKTRNADASVELFMPLSTLNLWWTNATSHLGNIVFQDGSRRQSVVANGWWKWQDKSLHGAWLTGNHCLLWIYRGTSHKSFITLQFTNLAGASNVRRFWKMSSWLITMRNTS